MARTAQTRFKKDIRIKPDEVRVKAARACARPDCPSEGSHQVPRSRDHLEDHLWFCLEHARAYNEAWDYFRDMGDAEIEAFREAAVMGHRPTWPLGKRGPRPAASGPDPACAT